CLEAYSHQDLPFEKLVAEAPNQRDTGRHPLFQVMLVLQPQPLPEPHWPGLLVEPIGVAHGSAKFDLLFSLTEHPDGLMGVAEYSTDLFDAATITRMVGHLQMLLTAIVRQPETAIAELELLTAPERKQLDSWNATTTLYPRDQCVHQLFEAQAARTPTACALVFGEQQLSYQALNAKANQLAHHLRTLGVRPETVVAIGMERCLDLVIGLLAILKAGGAYLPLDPTYPKERLAFMLHDSQAPLLLTQSALLAQWPDYSGQLVCLDTCWPRLAQESVANPPCQSVATQLAYIMYTSGSTGFPKGVKVCHYNIVRLLCNTGYARFDDRQRFLLLAPIAFDASVFEVWGGLLHGGCCVIYPQRTLMLDVLESIIVRQHITTLWLTAALFNAIIDEKPLILRTVAQILVGGEALSPSHIQRALQHLPDSQLINGYGPTESTTFACCYPIPKTITPHAIPIGWPIANTQVYILDKHLQPVPIGVVGEIHIGGDGLARGYLNQPELTAEKFIAYPFSADPAARLYKTGDLGRYLPDGAIDFLGRVDHQVKLRGFRIELGEIEAVLGQYPGIKEVAVIVREDVPGDKRLVAYLTQPPQGQPDIKALRGYIKAKLPDYMLPSAFVFLANLPLTANGKLDRNALPAPGHARSEQAQSYTPPKSPAEAALAAIWLEVLGIAQLGSHDNFFDLGGHSLLALVLCTKIEAKMGMPVPLELLFQCPTVSQLAKALAEGGTLADKNPSPILTAFQAEGSRLPFFWGLDGKIFAMLLEQIDVDQPLYLLKHQSTEGHKAKHRTIPEMAAYYIQGILQIDPVGPYYLGGYSVGGMIMYEVARQLCAQGKKVALLFMLDPPPIYQSGGKDRPICTLLWRRECDNLSYLGYVVYIRRLLVKLKMSFIISTYFYRKKPVPAQFFWPSVEPVYLQAMLIYKPGRIVGDIEKIVLVSAKKSVKTDSHADWAYVFDEADTYRVDCEHLDLKKEAFAFMWLDIFKRVLETVSRKAS
ncbi:MAG: amino acid adenylation domain-containing protein, partial [Methylovulum sp.]|nr:amino acid adenylation domain-containing protein [Methylovulum sp.]